MEPERTSPSGASNTNEVILPQTPAMSGALPIVATDPASDLPSMPRPRVWERQKSQNSLLMELLSRRMSRQTLLQQNQSRTQQPPLVPQSQPLLVDNAMDVDHDETLGDDSSLPALPCTQKIRPSRRYSALPYIAPVAPETKIDPDVAARVLARMQANTQADSISPPSSTGSSSVQAIEIDPTELAEDDIEADEGYDEGPEEFPWLGEKPSSGLTGALRNQGVLSFTTSAEAAMRCPKLVRNVPRMRKRTHKKKEHRLRMSRDTTRELSQSRAPAADAS
ncbi:hypothetical protein M431DRAFT_348164 [Trichoderma harzianum CBS 226.95]|uniref:Uncharacterized protein n=1 Tax=Trichoderma harzianum CBS 226.95 TaxID=983964 RepID=A0A2T4AKU5_TRIHA|nr:hypothetical protein M431DRAFT_348164 [Trichoderma harzianum CBS 226.95]PTB57689.1 hypothetical protein M431DRAFT_348164 [Trichoderma harzianum CBS 226.95]